MLFQAKSATIDHNENITFFIFYTYQPKTDKDIFERIISILLFMLL